MTDLAYAVWAQKTLGGTKTLNKALRVFGSFQAIYSAVHSGDAVPAELKRIKPEKLLSFPLEEAERVVSLCAGRSWKIVTRFDDAFPEGLRHLEDCPAVLFCDGNVKYLSSPYKISVVGTREPSFTGRSVAYKTGLYLSSAGVTVVSGAAFGIDNCAQEGAMLGVGGTVAVLGCGLGCAYVEKIPFSADRIRERGVMITEMLPFENPTVYTFPKRNRLIAALSSATAVIECSVGSGALITAELTVKNGGELAAVSPDVLPSEGTEKLLSSGAVGFTCPGDIPVIARWGLSSPFLSRQLFCDGLEGRAFLLEGALNEAEYSAYHHIAPGDEPLLLKKTRRSAADRHCAAAGNTMPDASGYALSRENASGYPEPDVPAGYENPALGEDEKTVLSVISLTPVYPDEISDRTGLDIVSVTVALTNLELEGLIRLNPGNTVTLN